MNGSEAAEKMAEAGGLDALEIVDAEVVEAVPIAALSAMEQGQINSQIATAHAYPRSIKRFASELESFATVSQDVALSCQFSLPRDGKRLVGASIRFAELVAAAYGNLRVEGIVGEQRERSVTAYGTCLDLEKNLGVRISVTRRITRRDGSLYGDDMIATTEQAAVAIARRNAILSVVPRALWQPAYEKARQVAAGGVGTFAERRAKAFEVLEGLDCSQAKILAHLGRDRVEDVVLDDVLLMRVVYQEIKAGTLRASDAFPAPALRATDEGRSRVAAGAQSALDGAPLAATVETTKKPAAPKGEPQQGSHT